MPGKYDHFKLAVKERINQLHYRLHVGFNAFRSAKPLQKKPAEAENDNDHKMPTKQGIALANYIADHCYIYYTDSTTDDPVLSPNGKHLSTPVDSLEEFKKYFKIEPKSDLSYVKRRVNKS